jgi:hypothetical protein
VLHIDAMIRSGGGSESEVCQGRPAELIPGGDHAVGYEVDVQSGAYRLDVMHERSGEQLL